MVKQTTKKRPPGSTPVQVAAAAAAANGASLEITPTRNADGSTTLKITLPPPQEQQKQQYHQQSLHSSKHGVKASSGKGKRLQHDEQQAAMLAKAAEAADRLGETAAAESLFLTAADLYRQMVRFVHPWLQAVLVNKGMAGSGLGNDNSPVRR